MEYGIEKIISLASGLFEIIRTGIKSVVIIQVEWKENSMEEKSGAQISKKAFIQSVIILLVIMLVAGVLTRVIPAGAYERLTDWKT